MTDELVKLENQYFENEQEIKRLTQENTRLKDEIVKMRWGIYRGAIVKSTKNEELYKVYGYDTFNRFNQKPWIGGSPQKKDGSFGTAKRYLYTDWEVVSL